MEVELIEGTVPSHEIGSAEESRRRTRRVTRGG